MIEKSKKDKFTMGGITPPPLFLNHAEHGKFVNRIISVFMPKHDKPMAVPYHRGYAYQAAKRGGGVREMLSIALPMVVSHACYTVMTFTDRLFLSRLSSAEMNAAMGGGITAFMMMTFFFGIIAYSTALTAQYFGAGQKNRCPIVITQAIILAIISYPIILLARPLGILLFEFMKISPEQMAHQKIYFNILIYGIIFGIFRPCFTGFFSGIGKTKIVMISSAVAMGLNIVVNYILIFGKLGFPALGIRGAAYGTIIGSAAGLSVMVWKYLSRENRQEYNIMKSFHFDKKAMGELLHFGYPAGIEMFLNLLAFSVLIMIFHSHSLATATAVTIVFNWDMVSFIPLLGVGISVTSLVGRYMGMGKPDIAHLSVMSGLKLSLVYSFFIIISFTGFTESLVGIFRPAQVSDIFIEAFPRAVFMLRMAAIYVTMDALIVIFAGALRGAGDSFWAMALSVAMHWTLVPVLYFMLKLNNCSPEQAWLAVVLIFVIFSFFIYLRYRSGKWRDIKVLQPAQKPMDIMPDDFHVSRDL
ncbi:MAG: MATE family efflux transporter [Elusimicrobia bacterium]|nr:MATE family efflux transporter [Elusimicrobiota bacterium]